MKKSYKIIFLILLILGLKPSRINGQCNDTILWIPFYTEIKGSDFSSRNNKFYVGKYQVAKEIYLKATELERNIQEYLNTKFSSKCYFVFLNSDGSKFEESHFDGEAYLGHYIKYYKNNKIAEEGDYSYKVRNQKIGTWRYFD